jgi:hypothetical protein
VSPPSIHFLWVLQPSFQNRPFPPGSPTKFPKSSALVHLERSVAIGAQVSFPLSNRETWAVFWCITACLTLIFLKGEVLLLSKIPKTDECPRLVALSSFKPASMQLWMMLTWFLPAGKRREFSSLRELTQDLKLRQLVMKEDKPPRASNPWISLSFLGNSFLPFFFERWHSLQEGDLELIVMQAAILS